ncbi:MAG: adenylate/guanylate cyclase domain-containing protein [Chloroflexi bacterium]|nr:adenylate/guanylate cyclase domain-containing protein [Chloroflexota bacterium]
MEQQLGFCTTEDGVSIAYATVGEGPPLVYATGFPGYLSLEWETPAARDLIEGLAQGVTLIRYDMRGSGLSDRDVDDLSMERWTDDLAAVVDHLNLDRFALLSLGFLAGPISIAYAAAHPERVSKLILSSAFLLGSELSPPDRAKAMTDYISAFGVPIGMGDELEPEEVVKFQAVARLQRQSASTEVQGAVVRAMFETDVRALADRISMPTLVVHGQGDDVVPFNLGRNLAAQLPNAKFVPFGESSATPWLQQALLLGEIRRFLEIDLGVDDEAVRVTGAPLTILFTDMESSTATTQRLGDAKAQELVRVHNSAVREALAEHGGSEIKHTGDGIMASFASASAGVACAVAIQRALESHNQGEGQALDPVHVRIGLNAGEPVVEDSDLFGTAVQLASRICDRAEPGEILASNVVRELVAGKGFLFADRGEVEMRGFEDPAHIYEVGWR